MKNFEIVYALFDNLNAVTVKASSEAKAREIITSEVILPLEAKGFAPRETFQIIMVTKR